MVYSGNPSNNRVSMGIMKKRVLAANLAVLAAFYQVKFAMTGTGAMTENVAIYYSTKSYQCVPRNLGLSSSRNGKLTGSREAFFSNEANLNPATGDRLQIGGAVGSRRNQWSTDA